MIIIFIFVVTMTLLMKPSHVTLLIFMTLSISQLFSNNTITESKDLIERVLPGHSSQFIIKTVKSKPDFFEISHTPQGKIVLKGNNGISIATAFNWYLKYVAHLSYDWQTTEPLTINNLPLPDSIIRKESSVKERFFNNTCTFGYTFPFWKWEQWQRFIDWMAMNGVNRPLMLAGQEATWLKVWESFGLSSTDIKSYFSGPAHLPWHRMANMDSWGGPLPDSYIEGQEKLQKKILARSRALGMEPILTAFAGHVPAALLQKYPKAKISRIAPGWGGMDSIYSTSFLDPTDPLFAEIQKRFLSEQKKMYGTDHLYSADPFNEITPPSWDTDYLAKVGGTIYNTMAAADKQAIWYQMSWTFYYDSDHWTQPRLAAMIHAVPKGKLVFLDYVCEEQEYFRKSNQFQGAPFIWCYLGNFGGNTHLVAPMKKVSERIINSFQVENCIGVGSTLEGINANQEIYEMTLELPWNHSSKFSADDWIMNYGARRSAQQDTAVKRAWKKLLDNVLVDSAVGIWNHCVVFQVSPVMNMKDAFWSTNPQIPYKNSNLAEVVEQMLHASSASKTNDQYQYDLVNMTRQLLGNYGMTLYEKMMTAYNMHNLQEFNTESANFINLGMELDSLLGTRKEFLLGSWLQDASAWGTNDQEKSEYLKNAAEIITTWHKAGGGLTDYANKQWNGLIRTYYLARWEIFIKTLQKSLQSSEKPNMDLLGKDITNSENQWINNQKVNSYLYSPQGDAVSICERLYNKYKDQIRQ